MTGEPFSRPTPAVVYNVLRRAQGGVCAHCGRPVQRMWQSVDHVVAKALGGAWGFGNVVLMHAYCNRRKGHRPPNGCELIWLLAVNARIGVGPQTFRCAA